MEDTQLFPVRATGHHMHAVRAHSVTCHLTQVNVPRPNLMQPGKLVLDLPTLRDGRLS